VGTIYCIRPGAITALALRELKNFRLLFSRTELWYQTESY
jgi:hypothetical protein